MKSTLARRFLQALLVTAAVSRVCSGQPAGIPDWQAPPYWSPETGKAAASPGERTAVLTGPLPLVGVTPCRLVDTRPEYAAQGF